jgi:hypothetical protein
LANYKTIRNYLVGLGFAVEHVAERKFQDALKRTGVAVEKFAKASAEGFTIVGGAFVAATAAVAGATVGLMRSTAQQDLGFQVFARRMMMGTDAAKKMKIATDALGYSLEEIIWGPPELAERYQQLIKDQTRMMELLGGDRGEKAFRNIRDIEFQFTRMGPALQYFGMRLTEDILNKLSGSPMALKERLQGFVDWFESPSGFVRISDKTSSVIAPAFLKLGAAVGSAFHWITGSTLTDTFNPANPRALDTLARNPGNSPFLGDVSGAFDTWPKLKAVKPSTLGGIWDSNKSVGQNLQDLFHFGGGTDQILGDLAASGRASGNAALMLALADQETGGKFNIDARNARTGAFGLGQIMPGNWPKGKSLDSEADQISVMNSVIFGNLRRRKGNLKDALRDYYMGPNTKHSDDWSPAPGEPSFDQYYSQFMDKYQRWQKDPLTRDPSMYHEESYHSGGGGVTVNVAHANATPDEIKRAVMDACDERDRRAMRQKYARAQGVYV